MRKIKIALGFLCLFFFLILGINAASARSLYWERIDVDLFINPDSSVDVVEDQEYVFTGAWNGGYRDIKIKGFGSISNVELWEKDVQYEEGSLDKYHFTLSNWGRDKRVKWRSRWPDEPEYNNTHKTFTLRYKVHDLISYHEKYDEVYWKAIFEERDGVVKNARVKVHFPQEVDSKDLAINLFTGAPGSIWRVVDSRTILFTGSDLAPGELFEVKVRFPPGMVEKKISPSKYIRTNISPYLPFGLLAAAFLVMIGAYWRLGRDYEIRGVPKVIPKVPADLSPALAGTVIDEEAGMKEVIATIIDLSRRGSPCLCTACARR